MNSPEQKVQGPAREASYLEAIRFALDDAMAANPKLLVLGEDVADREGGGAMGATRGLSTKYGDHRVRSTPIAEQSIMGAAIGAAMAGYKPVAEIMLMNFTTVAMDMIVNHAAKLRFMSGGQSSVPLVVRTVTGSGMCVGGQHSDHLEAWFSHVPGLKVVAPSTPADVYGLLLASIADPDPVIFIENLLLVATGAKQPIGNPGEVIPLGKARCAREGTDITVVTYSRTVQESLAAAEALKSDGISVEVIDLRTILPWDREAVLASGTKTGRVLVVHEAVREFGVGAEIAAEVSEALFGKLKVPVQRLGAPFAPVPFSPPLDKVYAPNAAKIGDTIRAMVR